LRLPSLSLKVLLLTLFINLLAAANTPFSYSYIPKKVYKKQLFPVTILVKHYNPKDPPHFEYDSLSLMQPIDYKPIRVINKDEAFFTFYFKAPSDKKLLKVPALTIWTLSYTYILQAKEVPINELEEIDRSSFSNLLASNFRVNSINIDTYDANSSLVTLHLEATEANIEDFHIPNVNDDGIENIKRDGARVTANYYFVIPSKQQKISFTYYNLIKNKLISIPVNIESSSHKVEKLNPKELTFDTIKKYTLIGATLLFLLLSYLTRDYLYLAVTALLIGVIIYLYLPNKSICVPEGASLYILPTNNSNVITQIERQFTTPVINEYRKFNKIEYNGLKGWIKDEDLCKD